MSLSLHYLVYQSTATVPMSEHMLALLLMQARAHNERVHITGLLLYCEGDFMQVLEGDQRDVQLLYEKISRDPRHRNVLLLADGPLAQRGFAQWSMAFRTLNTGHFRRLRGFLNLDQPDELLVTWVPETSLHALLLAFVHKDIVRF